MAEVLIARHAGACYGVERALRLAGDCAGLPCARTLGPLIHNPGVVERLAARGVAPVASLEGLKPGTTLVIRSHGVVPQVIDEANARGLRVVDATCPHVKKAHEGAADLAREGYQVVVVGEQGHPEVEGILARAGAGAVVAGSAADLEGARLEKRVGVVVQTTQSQERLSEVVCALLPRVRELRVVNTICAATVQRQEAARELASRVDAMVVVGGRNSGNTRRLAEVCSSQGVPTYHVESAGELEAVWFDGVRAIGVTAGASTPADQIDEVVAAIEGLCRSDGAQEGERRG